MKKNASLSFSSSPMKTRMVEYVSTKGRLFLSKITNTRKKNSWTSQNFKDKYRASNESKCFFSGMVFVGKIFYSNRHTAQIEKNMIQRCQKWIFFFFFFFWGGGGWWGKIRRAQILNFTQCIFFFFFFLEQRLTRRQVQNIHTRRCTFGYGK